MKINTWIKLGLILLLALGIRCIFFVGLKGGDDVGYIEYAYKIVDGSFSICPYLYGLRVGMIFPIAFFYKIFGVSEISTCLYPLLCSLGVIIIVFFLGKEIKNEKVGLWAAFLLSFFPLDIAFATSAFTESPVNLWLSLSVLTFLKAEKSTNTKWYFLLSGVFWGIGYLVKINAILLFLFYLAYAVYKRSVKKEWLLVGIGVSVILIVEGLIYFHHTGNFFYRLISTSGSYIDTPEERFSESFLWYPYYMFISCYNYGFFFHFVLAALFYLIIKRDRDSYIPILWMLCLFCYLEFGSRSITHYKPMAHEPRYLSLIGVPMMLTLASFFCHLHNLWNKWLLRLLVIFLFIISIFFSLINLAFQKEYAYNAKEMAQFLQHQPQRVIYTDRQTQKMLRYLFEFKQNDFIRTYLSPPTNMANSYPIVDLERLEDVYLFIDRRFVKDYTSQGIVKFPRAIYEPPVYWKLIKQIENPFNDINYLSLKLVKNILLLKFIPECIPSKRIVSTIDDTLKGNRAEIYYLPKIEKG